MNDNIISKNSQACLAKCETGYWVIAKINGKRTRLFAGTTEEQGEALFNHYE